MKYFYLTIVLFFSLNSYSQEALLGEWLLQSISIDGVQDSNIPDYASINFTTDPGDGDGLRLFGNGACNGLEGSYIMTSDNTIDIIYFTQSLSVCDTPEEAEFENKYFYQILYSGGPTTMQYSISGTGNNTTLTLTNTMNNNVAVYGTNALTRLSGEWFLHFILDLDVVVNNTDYLGMNIVFTENLGNLSIEGVSSCNTFNGVTTSVQQNYFEALPPLWTELDCNGDTLFDETGFYLEQTYKNFLYYNFDDVNFTPTRFDYSITGNGDDSILEIYNVTVEEESQTNIGYYAVYGRRTLSVNEYTSKNSSIRLKENPVSNELKLDIRQSLGNRFNYEILSLDGKQIIEGKLLENHVISTESLKSGMYFLAVFSNDNYSQTLKFIKE